MAFFRENYAFTFTFSMGIPLSCKYCYIIYFSGEAWGKETTWKTQA